MTLNLVPLPDSSVGKQRVIELLRYLLERAERGEILGITYVTDEPGSLGWGKANMTYPMVLGAFARATHHINKEWDGYTERKSS